MDLQLSDRVSVITGASKGIGLAVARTLLDEGAKVVATSRKLSAELDELTGPNLVHVPTHLMNPEAPGQVIDHAVDAFGGVDILVNNAGGPPPGVTLPRTSFFDASDADWQAMLEFNLLSAVRAVRAAIPRMLERGGGSIINVSTAHARQPSPMNVDYGVSKAGLANLTKALSEEFAPQGIRVNTVSPGPVRTAWWTKTGGAAEVLAERAGTDPGSLMDTLAPQMMNLSTGRLAEPQEIADAIVVLASPRSASTTGADVVVDCGFLKAL